MTFATLIDYFSYLLVALTVGLILYKSVELWLPGKCGTFAYPEYAPGSPAELAQLVLKLEFGLTALAVVASAAPFIGLMGTVLHIMVALSKVSTSLDTAIISGPIATALNSTLVGLASAVPASVAHAFFTRRIEVIRMQKELAL